MKTQGNLAYPDAQSGSAAEPSAESPPALLPVAAVDARLVARVVDRLVAALGQSLPVSAAAAEKRPGSHPSLQPCRWDEVANAGDADASVAAIVLLLAAKHDAAQTALVDDIARRAKESPGTRVLLVGTFLRHFADARTIRDEAEVRRRLDGVPITFLRAGHLLGDGTRLACRLRSLSWLAPLVPRRISSTFLNESDLWAMVATEAAEAGTMRRASCRELTLLGRNRPWREVLGEHNPGGPLSAGLRGLATVLSFLLVGQLVALFVGPLRRWSSRLRSCWFDTLYPQSVSELLSLYNCYGYRDVKVVGYNTGVVHFGQTFPGRTVVSTIKTAGPPRIDGYRVKLDAGTLMRTTIDALRADDKELFVVPNYSYISMGTCFFVPVHGSGSEVTTVADTIERVLLYDPVEDRLVATSRSEEAFGRYLYNPASGALLLRLYVRAKEKSRYFVKQETLSATSGEAVLEVFADREPSNIEIRKSQAASETIDVYKYYDQGDGEGGGAGALEMPKDAIGRLWDRLEENPISSYLFHAMVRKFGYHVELFFTKEEFVRFWETHTELPISKIQLRYVKQDGMPHSPFGKHDCISADLFMRRKHSSVFQEYLRNNFSHVQSNVGKHSMLAG